MSLPFTYEEHSGRLSESDVFTTTGKSPAHSGQGRRLGWAGQDKHIKETSVFGHRTSTPALIIKSGDLCPLWASSTCSETSFVSWDVCFLLVFVSLLRQSHNRIHRILLLYSQMGSVGQFLYILLGGWWEKFPKMSKSIDYNICILTSSSSGKPEENV